MAGVVAAVVVLCGFLVGTFPTARLVARRSGRDVAAEGSGNPGATNVYRIAGARAGLVVFAGDAVKGALPAAVGLLVSGRTLALVAGAAAVVGHCFPPQRRFRGGRGVATSVGLVLVVDPLVAALTAVLWFAVVRVSRRASLGSLAGAVAAPVTAALLGRDTPEVVVFALVALLVLFRHAPNIGRLARGREGPLGPAGGDGRGLG
jgi:glycerol-3-phosphate acyltransferase PlsY